jgi:uncharacterized protein YggE
MTTLIGERVLNAIRQTVRTTAVALHALVLMSGQLPAQVEAPGAPATIVTTGEGKVALPPDRAVVSLGIYSQSATAARASSENGVKQQEVLEALHTLGFTDADIQATRFSVSPQYDYEHSDTLTGYRAQADVKVYVAKLDQLGALIDAVLGAGGSEIDEIVFVSDSASIARNRALTEALQQARRDAATLASASGGQLGELIEVSTIPPPSGPSGLLTLQPGSVVSRYAMIAPMDVTVSVMVYARWSLASQ